MNFTRLPGRLLYFDMLSWKVSLVWHMFTTFFRLEASQNTYYLEFGMTHYQFNDEIFLFNEEETYPKISYSLTLSATIWLASRNVYTTHKLFFLLNFCLYYTFLFIGPYHYIWHKFGSRMVIDMVLLNTDVYYDL